MTSVLSLNSIGWLLAELAHFWNFGWLAGWAGLRKEIGNQIVIQSRMSWLVTMQNFNSIAQSVLKLSHCKKVFNNDNDDDDDDTHQGWIIVRDGRYSVADKKNSWKRPHGELGPIHNSSCTDRLMLYIFTIATVFGTLVLLLNQPFILDNIDQRKVLNNWQETHQVITFQVI